MFVHQFIPKASTSDTVCYFNLYKLKVTGQGPPQPWRCTINTILTWVTWQFDDKWKCLLTQKPLKNIADSFAVDLGRQEGLKKQRLYFTFGQFWQQPGNKQTTCLSPNRTQTSGDTKERVVSVFLLVITEVTPRLLSQATRPTPLGCPSV